VDVAVIGGTGEEGYGLSLRLARAGEHVIIGSRSQDKGAATATTARALLGADANIDGMTNEQAAPPEAIVSVTVPYAGQADIYRAIAPHVPQAAIVVDCTSPLGIAVGGRAWQVVRPWHGSAAEQAKALLGSKGKIVAAFHTIAGSRLQDLEHPMDSDVLVCGDAEGKVVVGGLIEKIPNLRWVDCGDLSQARISETLTALLISINRAYKVHDAGFRITGRDSWGRPGG